MDCSHLHHGNPEAADLVILDLSFGIDRHGVGVKPLWIVLRLLSSVGTPDMGRPGATMLLVYP